jgi:hypothetical protein
MSADEAGGHMLWLATPVHLVAGLASVHLDARGLLRVDLDARRTLARDFNTVFAQSAFRLEALPSAGFLLSGPRLDEPDAIEPARILGASVTEVLPAASTAPTLRRLLAEIEMWLHEHPVNMDRMRRGRLPVTALWLWGGGVARAGVDCGIERSLSAAHATDAVPASFAQGASVAATGMPSHDSDVAFGDDPYLHGLWRMSGRHARALPTRFEDVLGNAAGRSDACESVRGGVRSSGRAGSTAHSRKLPAQRAVLVLELSRYFDAQRNGTIREALAELDRHWIAGALDALRRRDIARVTLIANDHRLTLGSRDHWKLWRVPRPALTAF